MYTATFRTVFTEVALRFIKEGKILSLSLIVLYLKKNEEKLKSEAK